MTRDHGKAGIRLLGRLLWISPALLAAIILLTVGSAAGASQAYLSDEALCLQLPSHLIPLQVSRVDYRPHAQEGATEYVGHELTYTELRLPNGYFVFSAGYRFVKDEDGRIRRERDDLSFSSASFFHSALWAIGVKEDDLGEYGLRSDIRLLASVTSFMKRGAAADAEYLANRNSRVLTGNLMYDCQGCNGAPEFTRTMAQDMSTLRFALMDGRYYAVTTSPLTVVAEFSLPDKPDLENPEPPARYFACPARIGAQIRRDTEQARHSAKSAKAISMEPGDGG